MLAKGKFLFLLVLVIIGQYASAQNVGIGTTAPHPSAKLEIKSNISGLLIPRLTTSQRDAIQNPAHSLLIFNIDNFCIEVYDSASGSWLAVSCPISCPVCDTVQCLTPQVDSISGPTILCPGDTVQYVLHGSGGNAFIWNIPANWVLLSQGQIATFIADSSGTIYGHLCNQCGCATDSIVVSAGSAPSSVLVSGPDSICVLDTLVLVASGTGSVTYYSWQIPSGWTVIGPSNGDTLVAVPSSTGSFTFNVQACNGCGCSPASTHTVSITGNVLSPAVSIQGPSFVCLPDTVVYKAPHSSGNLWTWQYPSSWQVLAQGGDSIVLLPDTADGKVIVQVCDTMGCACDVDTVFVSTDTCRSFCLAIGGTNWDYGHYFIQTAYGGYAITGGTNSFGQGDWDVYVVKLDASGNVQWTRTIGGANDDRGWSIVQTTDGGYAIAGWTNSFGQGWYDVYVVKLDASGNVQWTRTIGGANVDYGYSIIQTTDGGYAIAGWTQSFGQGSGDVYVVKLDANGNVQWTRTIGGVSDDRGRSIVQASDGGYAIAGWTHSFGQGSFDVYVVKLDASGNVQWTRTIGGVSGDAGWSIIQTTDGGYAIAGITQSFGQGSFDVYVVKLDASGNVQWTRTIGGADWDEGWSIIQTADGGYAIAGGTDSFGQGGRDVYVVKLDASGNVQWTRTIGGVSGDAGLSIIQTTDGGYAIAGYTESFGQGNSDVYVVKLDASGNLVSCPGGCQVSSGGIAGSGGVASTGGVVSQGGVAGTGGIAGSGGTLTVICP